MVLYWDLFLFVHTVTDGVLLWLTARLGGRRIKSYRFLLGTAVCVGLSFCFCLPALPSCLGSAVGLLSGALTVGVAFGFTPVRSYIKTLGVFVGTEAAYVGILFLCMRLLPATADWFLLKNGVVYYNFPVPYLFGATGIISVVVIGAERFFAKKIPKRMIAPCRITLGGREVRVRCLTDTGNRLRDPLSGLPVAVIRKKELEPLACFGEDGGLICSPDSPVYTRFRVVSFHGAGGTEGIMQAFRPDSFIAAGRECAVLVAVDETGGCGGTEYDGIMPVLTEGENG